VRTRHQRAEIFGAKNAQLSAVGSAWDARLRRIKGTQQSLNESPDADDR
jgi:hypothetical protein